MENKVTALEKLFGHPITEMTATLLGGVGSLTTPIAALLPVLTNTFAGRRQQSRIEATLIKIAAVLQEHEEKLKELSDEQYHLLLEVVSSTFQTIDQEKLKYLQSAVRNSFFVEGLVTQEATVLARIIRDISAEEADFVFRNSSFKYIHVTDVKSERGDKLQIPRNSKDSLIVSGLETLGVLEFGLSTMGDGNILTFSSITKKLRALLES